MEKPNGYDKYWKPKAYITVAVFCTIIRFFCGVYTHAEYGDSVFFIKNHPTWKWHFSSPLGGSDLRMQDLTPSQQREQKAYDEFVRNRIF